MAPMQGALAVIAKAPSPGRVKTRLCPPCTPGQAATLAEAALRDTLAAVLDTPCERRLLFLDGEPDGWADPSFELIAQRGRTLDERLAAAFEDARGPTLLIGMDTPQVTASLLTAALRALAAPRTDAVLGSASDGGYWAIGLTRPDPRVFLGVPMSTSRTGEAQLERLREFGLRVRLLRELRDVDRFDDARAAAELGRGTRFEAAFRSLGLSPAVP
jgi:rSAM/selenodomain-associated transferase 1